MSGGMRLKDELLPIGSGIVLTVVAAAVVLFAFAYLLVSEPVKAAVISDQSFAALGLSLIALYGLEAFIIFFFPPVITTLVHERKGPSGNAVGLYATCFVSSAIALLIVIALIHLGSGWGLQDLFSGLDACCLVMFLVWSLLSGLVGPALSWAKNAVLKRHEGKAIPKKR